MKQVFALSALVAGILRIVATFIPEAVDATLREALYCVIDLGLILGCIGLYVAYNTRLKLVGSIGFVLSVSSLAFIAGPDAQLFGTSAYQLGSPFVGLGVVLLSFGLLHNKLGSRAASLFLIASVIAGALAMLNSALGIMVLVSGVLFGLGFVSHGYHEYKYS